MSEIQRRDPHAGPLKDVKNVDLADNVDNAGNAGAAGGDREAKVEQLLLAGLDHYFAAEYEQAINVWTRVLFLDRNHARARAYIERARSAVAEHQRRSEELLHDGVAAFRRGENHEARRLLRAAIDGGAPADEALAILDRLNRPTPADSPATGESSTRSRRHAPLVRGDREGASRWSRSKVGASALTVLFVAVLAFGGYVVSTSRPDWQLLLPFLSLTEPSAGAVSAPVAQDLSLPLPERGEVALAQARALAAGGHLHEALLALDQVRPTDVQKEEADRLRGELQRQLLALTPMPAPLDPGREKPADATRGKPSAERH